MVSRFEEHQGDQCSQSESVSKGKSVGKQVVARGHKAKAFVIRTLSYTPNTLWSHISLWKYKEKSNIKRAGEWISETIILQYIYMFLFLSPGCLCKYIIEKYLLEHLLSTCISSKWFFFNCCLSNYDSFPFLQLQIMACFKLLIINIVLYFKQ